MRIGTHNLTDTKGRPSFFADVILLTEAVPSTIRARLKRRWARARGYQLLTCAQQRDLCIAYRRDVFEPDASEYHRAHGGEPWFTPHRGTYVVMGKLDGRPTALVVEHRINGAFDPRIDRRAERRRLWNLHTGLTLATIDHLHHAGYFVIAGGDLNTWPGHSGYRGTLREVGGGLDRLAISKHIGHLEDPEHLSRLGSTHRRLRATLRFRSKR